jgi:hypothetical protein
MHEDDSLHARAVAHISAAARRTPADHARLAAMLRAWCWPGGLADSTAPLARGWVRRWAPACLDRVVVDCTCEQGRCTVCN